jgi:hypothetical protein
MLYAYYTLKNARKRLANLKYLIEGGGRVEIDAVTAYRDPGDPSVIHQNIPNPVDHISPEIGSIASDFKAVLDQLIHAAYEVRNGKPPGPKSRTQFPVCKCPNDFRASIKRDLEGIPIIDHAFIEKLQPYNGHHCLLLLKSLANPYKHRRNPYLHAEDVLISGHASYSQADAENFLTLPKSGVRVPKSVQVNAHFRGKVTMKDGTPVIDALEVLQAEIASVFDSFKLYFGL